MICGANMIPIPNDMTFPINLSLLAGGVTVRDEDVCADMRFAFEHFEIVTEHGAAVSLAGALNGQVNMKDKTIATITTGGNMEMARHCALIEDAK